MLGHPQQGVLHRRQFIQPCEIAIEGLAALEVGHVDADFNRRVGVRRIGRDHQLQGEAGWIGRQGRAPAIAHVLEYRRRVALRPEAGGERRLVGEMQREEADARRLVDGAGVVLAPLLQPGGELDLPAADAEQDHLLPAAEVDGPQRLQAQHLVVELDHLVAALGCEPSIDVHRLLSELRPHGRRVCGVRGERAGSHQQRGGEKGGLDRFVHGHGSQPISAARR